MKPTSDQTRAIIAAALSLLIIMIWSAIYKPAPRPTATSEPETTLPAAPGSLEAAQAAPRFGAGTRSVPATTDSTEKTIVVESDLYRIELSNRGAVVRSWQLKEYNDEEDRTLDLVHAEVAEQTGGWPFSLQLSDALLQAAANQELYVVTSSGGARTTLAPPAEVEFRWSDGSAEVTKTLRFDSSYTATIETEVRNNGQPVSHSIAWRGGFGDITAYQAGRQTTVFGGQAGKITTIATDDVGDPDQRSRMAVVPGAFDAAGIEDLYFAAAFLPQEPPAGQAPPANLTLSARQIEYQIAQNGNDSQMAPEMAAGSTAAGPLALRLYVGPKDLDILKAFRPPLGRLVQFGWTGFIAEPLFYLLRWIYRYIPNYGWAIVFMTIGINMLLYPLKLKSWRSMQKMQSVAPEIRSIQDRYKKYAVRDPRKADMNKEVMAVYSRQGINPMGSCLPMVAQLPVWFGLYRMLTVTIELRHAPWMGWIRDLSGPDPLYILPIAMALLMWAAQKMTPTTVSDPAQQRMMSMMPIVFGGMFVVFPVSSGLVLYILTSNVVAISQQWYLNRTAPLKAPAKGKKK